MWLHKPVHGHSWKKISTWAAWKEYGREGKREESPRAVFIWLSSHSRLTCPEVSWPAAPSSSPCVLPVPQDKGVRTSRCRKAGTSETTKITFATTACSRFSSALSALPAPLCPLAKQELKIGLSKLHRGFCSEFQRFFWCCGQTVLHRDSPRPRHCHPCGDKPSHPGAPSGSSTQNSFGQKLEQNFHAALPTQALPLPTALTQLSPILSGNATSVITTPQPAQRILSPE